MRAGVGAIVVGCGVAGAAACQSTIDVAQEGNCRPGALNPSFNGGHVAKISYEEDPVSYTGLYAIQQLSTGKILVSGLGLNPHCYGPAIAARLLADGTLDTTFVTTGLSSQVMGDDKGVSGFIGLAREPDGAMLFVGSTTDYVDMAYTPSNIYLFRYTDSGVLQSIPGDDGIDIVDLDGSDEEVVTGVPVPGSTDMLVAGSKDGQLFVARVEDRLSTVNHSFAAPDGFIVPALGGSSSSAAATAIDSVGRVVVTGWITTDASGDDMVLLRLSAAGALDSSFGVGGVVTAARPGDQHGSSVVVQPDGAIVVASATTEGSEPQLLVQRFLDSGAVDPSFGTAGVALAPLGAQSPDADWVLFHGVTAWMVELGDGRLVVAGNGSLGGVAGPVLARFAPDGSPDPTFGTNGELRAFAGTDHYLSAMSLTTDGNLLLACGSLDTGASIVARLCN